MALIPINSVMRLLLPVQVDLSLDPRFRGYVEDLINAIQQLQSYVEQYCGITQKLNSQWSQLQPTDTLLEHQVNRLYLQAGEGISAGAMVNIYDSGGGVMKLRNANATTNAKAAHGFCSTAGGIAAAAYGEIIVLRGLCSFVSGLTPGARYFMSTVNGLVTVTEPAAAGNIGQYVGLALSATLLLVDINSQWIQH